MDTRKQKRTLRLVSLLLMLGGGVGLFFLYFWMYTAVLGYDLPGTVLRRQKNAELTARVGNIGLRLHQQEDILEGLKLRDETIYRSLFDLPSIPDQRRKEGILSEGERYPDLKGADHAGLLRRTALLLDKVEKMLQEAGIAYVELGGVVPNPLLSKVKEGIELCRAEGVDFILAVGGGSVIDSSKAIGYGVPYDGDMWDFWCGKARRLVCPLAASSPFLLRAVR